MDLKGRDFLTLKDFTPEEIEYLVDLAEMCIRDRVMQIVQKLAGYTLGRSDLVRRAMSKKKAAVMEKERQNFVFGNPEEGVPGCIANGIPEQTAQKIYDEMIDFAKYAFNKSHAAAYAVVAYQTAWLKYYYPVEFMAALMTSVIDNPGTVSYTHLEKSGCCFRRRRCRKGPRQVMPFGFFCIRIPGIG